MSLAYLPEHADNALLALELARKEAVLLCDIGALIRDENYRMPSPAKFIT